MQKIYSRTYWENFPSEKTAIDAMRLNNVETGIDNLDDRVVAMDASKVDLTKANELVKEITYDESNGTLTITKMNGSKTMIDTKLEKLAVNFAYNPQTQQLIITLDDGTVQNVDLSALITEYEFLDSDTIAFEIADGKVKAIVKNGSITEDHLSPDYLGEIRTQVGKAEMSAKSADASEKSAVSSSTLAKSYAAGGTGTRDGEDADNAKYYAEQAKNASDVGALAETVKNHISDKIMHMTESEHGVVSKLGESAEGSLTYNGSEIKPSVATTESTGIVKPDGTTITIDEDGTIHGKSEITVDGTTITLDEAKGIISLAKTLQDKIKTIDNKLPKTSVVNTNTTTEAGFALDARQANPNIEGTVAAKILQLNNDLNDINGRMAVNKYYVMAENGGHIEIDSIGFGIIIVNNEKYFGLYIYNKPYAIFMYTIAEFPGISFDIKSDSIVIKNIPLYTTIKVLQ